MNRYCVAPLSFLFILANPAYAFGTNDLFSIIIDMGGKVGSAVIDKTIDAFKDPTAEAEKKRLEEEEFERKRLEAYQKTSDEIESRTDLTPLQRERLTLQLRKQLNMAGHIRKMTEAAEAQQKAERGKILTTEGFTGAAIQSATSTPSMAMMRADAMVKTGDLQKSNRAILSSIDNRGNTIPMVPNPAAVGAVQQQANSITQASSAIYADELERMAEIARRESKDISALPVRVTVPFERDMGKRIYVEFTGSKILTEKMRVLLVQKGHVLSDSRNDSDVQYVLLGEYRMQETNSREGITEDVGALFDNPRELATPEEKTGGKIKGAIAGGLLGLFSGGQVSAPAPKPQRQDVLIVCARQVRDERETRVSSLVTETGSIPKATSMVNIAMGKLLSELGFDPEKEIPGTFQIAASQSTQ